MLLAASRLVRLMFWLFMSGGSSNFWHLIMADVIHTVLGSDFL